MSSGAPSATLDSGALPNLPMQVRGRTLLIMMLSVPLCILAALADTYLFGGYIHNYSLENPIRVVWWVAILSTPHILASIVTFADREYLAHYKKPLLKATAIGVALGIGLPLIAGLTLLSSTQPITMGNMLSHGSSISLIAAAAYTTYHNLQQQYGISLMLMREKPDFIHHLWKWITIIPASLIFIGMNFLHLGEKYEIWERCMAVAAVNLFLAALIAAYIIWRYMKRPDRSNIGLAYFCANAAMIAACFFLAMNGYILFAMLTPRLVHDLTAYWIYMVHDENRNTDKMRNPFYALPRKIGLRPVIVCIPLSFILGFALLKMGQTGFIISFFVVMLNYIHYYIEGIIWKRGTPHRQHVPFT
jgi:hypothetical protein